MSKRLISQNGLANLPFDTSTIFILGETVYGYGSVTDRTETLAKYSTQEKAKNVLWLMNYTLAKENIFEFPQEEEIL